MRPVNQGLWRLAIALHARLVSQNLRETTLELPTHSWQCCTNLIRQIRRSQLRGWHLAANVLSRDLGDSLQSVQRVLTLLQQQLVPVRHTPVMAAGDLYKDLIALQEEFEELDFDLGTSQLSVTTGPILLSGVYLGPFAIQWNWNKPVDSDNLSYRIIAKDPHPAESRESVTHPHVMDERLCEGDGKQAIGRALREGRLLDFFTLIASVLRTYNPESPFVELALWGGSPCSDCGSLVDEDYRYSCHRCGDTVCDECEVTCGGCEDYYCSGCITQCSGCEEGYCHSCLKPCEECHRRVCAGCLDEQERCATCHEDESENEDGLAATASPEVQPDCLVQAALPA